MRVTALTGVAPRARIPFEYEELTIPATVVQLNPAKVALASSAYIRLSGGPVRYLHHGVDPTASFGFKLFDTEVLPLLGDEMVLFRALREGVTNGLARVSYYRD